MESARECLKIKGEAMKSIVFWPVVMLLIMNVEAHSVQTEWKIEDVKTEIAKHLEKSERGFVKIMPVIESDTPLAKLGNGFFEDNILHIDYLTKHDTNYMESVVRFFCLYLVAKNHKTSGFDDQPKKSYSLHDLKATAVRFFFPMKVTEDGKIGTRICVTGEGFRDYPERNLDFEAFIFNAIFSELKKKEKSFLLPRIQEYNKLAVALGLSTDEKVLLTRAQGFMWAMFYMDKDLEKLILDSYQKKAKYLPFKLVSE